MFQFEIEKLSIRQLEATFIVTSLQNFILQPRHRLVKERAFSLKMELRIWYWGGQFCNASALQTPLQSVLQRERVKGNILAENKI